VILAEGGQAPMNLPNVISLARLLAAPLGIWLIIDQDMTGAFVLFVIAGLSDAVDGFIAKHFDQRSELGALLDPIADKALIVGMTVTLGFAGFLPNWVVILVVFRDMLIVGGFLLGLTLARPMQWQPLAISKLNTVLQIVLIGLVLGRAALGVNDHGATGLLADAVGITTVVSGAFYLVRWMRVFAGNTGGTRA
jgi:cardiolipin synthase (CMP-forming)